MHIDKQAVENYLDSREEKLKDQISTQSVGYRDTVLLRGALAELRKFRRSLEFNFAYPEGRNGR